MGNRQDSFEAEVFPFFQISNIPPLVHLGAISYAKLSSNQVYCLVWSRQILHDCCCWPIEAELGSEITITG